MIMFVFYVIHLFFCHHFLEQISSSELDVINSLGDVNNIFPTLFKKQNKTKNIIFYMH